MSWRIGARRALTPGRDPPGCCARVGAEVVPVLDDGEAEPVDLERRPADLVVTQLGYEPAAAGGRLAEGCSRPGASRCFAYAGDCQLTRHC